MFKIDKESLLSLNKAMNKTIEDMDFNNPEQVGAFASSMVSIGNQINMSIIKSMYKELGEDDSND